jgi:hypothetical protein
MSGLFVRNLRMNTINTYRHNHYVPEWYQRRFMLPEQSRYFRLDLRPDPIPTAKGKKFRDDLHEWSPKRIFAENDIYTTLWAGITNTEIEQYFFGQIDGAATAALDYFDEFEHPSVDAKQFQQFLRYTSLQKLRTPKGLAYLAALSKQYEKNATLMLLQRVQDMFCATWTECIWQIADASDSPTKFIISDHPVTVYNRGCPPLSKYCKGHADPDIRLAATHTYFPLSLNKILILTNLNWVRDPYQKETAVRPNPILFRGAMFNFTTIQTGRRLTENEVLQINLITKKRAYRYIAGANKEWLYPERRVSTDHWKKLGEGYLLMPEPRLVYMGGETFIGYQDGHSEGFSEYGHKPWQRGYKDEDRFKRESEALYRFQAEWALLRGAKYTAENYDFGGRQKFEDDPESMEHHRKLAKKYRSRMSRR